MYIIGDETVEQYSVLFTAKPKLAKRIMCYSIHILLTSLLLSHREIRTRLSVCQQEILLLADASLNARLPVCLSVCFPTLLVVRNLIMPARMSMYVVLTVLSHLMTQQRARIRQQYCASYMLQSYYPLNLNIGFSQTDKKFFWDRPTLSYIREAQCECTSKVSN